MEKTYYVKGLDDNNLYFLYNMYTGKVGMRYTPKELLGFRSTFSADEINMLHSFYPDYVHEFDSEDDQFVLKDNKGEYNEKRNQ